jgi:predicted DNA-binding ribbon-helix-helix protein
MAGLAAHRQKVANDDKRYDDPAAFVLEKRHITIDGKRMTIALEVAYWRLLDKIAAAVRQSWQEWTPAALADLPASVAARACWLRLTVVDKVMI